MEKQRRDNIHHAGHSDAEQHQVGDICAHYAASEGLGMTPNPPARLMSIAIMPPLQGWRAGTQTATRHPI